MILVTVQFKKIKFGFHRISAKFAIKTRKVKFNLKFVYVNLME